MEISYPRPQPHRHPSSPGVTLWSDPWDKIAMCWRHGLLAARFSKGAVFAKT
jgi:hypothetical protein